MAVFSLGREEKLYAVAESTYGTAASNAAATDALRFRECSFTKTEERIIRDDKRNTRSPLATIVRRVNAEWSVGGYLLPSGAAGTRPDGWDEILKAGFGTETVTGATSVAYTLAKEFTKSLSLHRAVGNALATAVFSELYVGCVVDKLSFMLSGTDEAKLTASGFGADMYRAGTGTTTADTGTVATLTGSGVTGEGHNFDAGAYVDLGSGVTGQLISATAATTITVPSHSAVSNGTKVIPSAVALGQTFVSTSAPIAGVLGSCSLEGSTCDIIQAQINLTNGAQAHNNIYGTNKTSDYHLGNRMVDGQLQIRLTDTNFIRVAKTRRSTTVALTLVSGTTAGLIATFSLPAVQIDFSSIPSNAVEDMIVTLPFKAYGSSGEDELSLTLT